MQIRSKVETFIGFSVKARAFIGGAGSVGLLKKAFLILVCDSASQNTKEQAEKYANKFHCPLMVCKIMLEDVSGKANCKIAAITDRNLAKAILDNQDDKFSVFSGGNGL